MSSVSLLVSEDVEDDDLPPPSYESVTAESYDNEHLTLSHNDPRSRSTQSLLPSPSDAQGDRRKLLLIFIHGFMGDETSFQSFPAHVHSLVAALLSETHIVHTKIYPRYRSKKKIDFARDDFSRWLSPHEGPTTDVILLGHSMGGLLSAEVALIPSLADGSLRHRLIGTINFDVPFLGMHPRVVKVGLASIFSPAPPKSPHDHENTPSGTSTHSGGGYFDDTPSASASSASVKSPQSSSSPSQFDPNYNPAYKNDVILPVRKGWEGAWYFLNKHSSDLRTATKQLVKSHLEFGGAMADYNGLKLRYTRIRGLEEQSERTRKAVVGSSVAPPRVRFVNYYTSSTGRPKKPRTPTSPEASVATPTLATNVTDVDHKTTDQDEGRYSAEFTTQNNELVSMDHLEPTPMSEVGGDSSDPESWVDATENMELGPSDSNTSTDATNRSHELEQDLDVDTTLPEKSPEVPAGGLQSLPPVPDPPAKPEKPPFFADKDARKLAEKEYDRVLRLYFRALKDREKALRDREKLEKKRERQAIKEGKRAEKEVSKNEKSKEKERKKTVERRETDQENSLAAEQKEAQKETPSGEEQKAFKDRTFCTLPPKDNSGIRDPTWVRVIMKDVDLVEAHCGLFFPDPNDDRYEKLIGDVGERVCEWVGEAESERVAREFEAQD
ncbi:uncharacterized protein M437DRAFT_43709 [Aureobasidium melanogenum CBS 110374]|uniref:AB hydrolase-1 domain-containing protein n=1 Tax=Aureobasidium melanogenum (strain CBS 110374) TaxID=1043003 RepID=A0A074W489_AURM1|nr:uncharacterized protein M437DRAFT_43709 [Aureobasidium melanogenum CBS 110374]KEQ64717.1 hypothetical protein M437DRAFT_43709 [Aureobasidium melanogenum CBS 110374]